MSNSTNKKIGPVIPLMIVGVIFFMIGFGVGISWIPDTGTSFGL